MAAHEILVVDDEVGIRELLREILHDEGYIVALADNAGAARIYRSQKRPDLVLLDIWMPDTDGITLLKEWESSGLLTMPVIMMSGHGTIDTAVEATRIGAADFLEKPIALQKLLSTVERALKKGEPLPCNGEALAGLGTGAAVSELKMRLAQVANQITPLLLTGEAGAGMELCARYLHRSNTPWVAPETLAVLADDPLSLLEQARDGLLYLDEIGNLGKLEQKGLALILNRLEKYGVRLVCATSMPLPQLVEEGAFDARLFQAINGLALAVPSLREHSEDIPDLARQVLARLIETGQSPQRHFSAAALNLLREENWPGNLPQLDNAVKTLALTALSKEITAEDVSRVLGQFAPPVLPAMAQYALPLDQPLREARDEFERIYFEHQLKKVGGNMSRLAESVGLERTHLYRKLKQLGIPVGKGEVGG
ncbi:sigma-54 dependent transcriptional regulator [Sulfuricella sp.]|uniref:sigma-54-dependent transcriptional regulator n=1 Tax=Sulfuricella sp. TaxID=2099377 RepID=UPI002B916F2B|nr:sigma-54 dependent transcriptional regulator [Sulfuricella sp.]HUX65403.1 sigma-54 dependent transcriptional regulator [Sulfuricella sp.]